MKRFLAVTLSLLITAAFITGCGSTGNSADANSNSDDKVITVGASPSPHAEILAVAKDVLAEQGYTSLATARISACGEGLAVAKDVLAEQGYTLDVKEYSDYIQPNVALSAGDLDANYFQHKPYLDDYNKNNSTDLVSAAAIHYEPFGLYSTTIKSLDELKDGDKVAVPNDATNEARALLLLQDNGVIKLKDDAGLSATKNDIVENPKNLDITEIEAAQLPRSINNVAIAAINGNYAVEAGLKVSDAIAVEAKDSLAAETYANIVAVRPDNKDDEKIKALISALQSDKVKSFIDEKYQGAVVAVF